MLTQTTESAVRALIYLASEGGPDPLSPRSIAERLGLSPTYMAKVATLLVKANILRAHRGVLGGVNLNRPADTITLLAIVEACQGHVVGDFCQVSEETSKTCAYHRFASELQSAIVGVLSRWTLADLAAKPGPSPELMAIVPCKMTVRLQPQRRLHRGGAENRSAATD